MVTVTLPGESGIAQWNWPAELPGPRVRDEALPMTVQSDLAELSSLRAQVDEITRRVVQMADGYRDTEDSAVASELDQGERSLTTARRALDRAATNLVDLA
jgi:hypothetical protein